MEGLAGWCGVVVDVWGGPLWSLDGLGIASAGTLTLLKEATAEHPAPKILVTAG